MQSCEFCGSGLPLNAHFCGNCGRLLTDVTKGATEISSPSYFNLIDVQAGQEDADPTIRHSWPGREQVAHPFPYSGERQTDEERAVLPDMIQPFAAMQVGQPPAGNVPMVQGAPQVGEVPAVHGTPAAPSGPASVGHGLVQNAASVAPPHAPSWEAAQQHPVYHPIHPVQPTPPPHRGVEPPAQHPIHPPQSTPPLHHRVEPAPEHHMHRPAATHVHRPRIPRVHGTSAATASKVAAGAAAKWIILVVVAVVVVATGGAVFVLANSPGLSLSGSSTIAPGSMLHLHGKGFLPGGSITLIRDNGQPVALAGPGATGSARQGTGRGLAAASALQLVAGQVANHAASTGTIPVSPIGTFDVDIVAQSTWSPGPHTIHATENLGSRSASLSFTLLKPALTVNPSSLDFGTVQMGMKVVRSILVGNSGGLRLNWSASTDSSPWLKLQGSVGAIEANGPQESVFAAADATHLKGGTYTATITIHSNGGDAHVDVSLRVIPASPNAVKQARIDVNPASLDFGQLPPRQQVIKTITVGNLGTAALKWKMSADNPTWLTLSTTSGTVQTGAIPQTIEVVVNTTGLQAGSNSATIAINSNGGNTTVPVTFTVIAPPPGSPPPTPTPPPPVLGGAPSGFSVPGDSNCTYDQYHGWTCIASLSSFANAQSNLNWSASSNGISGVTFTPQSGTLTPGQTTQVTIFIPNTVCPTNATFTFTGPTNQIIMPWSCAPLTLTVSRTIFDANSDCSFSNGWTCSLTLDTGPNDQGELSWSASSSGIRGISFNPSSGIVTGGEAQPVAVTITVPGTTCPANANLTFSGQGANSDMVSWSCSPSTLAVSKSSLNGNTDCTFSNGWTCRETLSLSSNKPGDPSLNWSASGSGTNGISFSPASGTVASGQQTRVTITVPATTCPATATFTFAAQGANTVNVPWSCTPPKIDVSPHSFNIPDNNCSYTAGQGWACTVSLTDQDPQQSASWSVSSSGINGVTFTPSSGVVSPGQSASVTITIPDVVCPASAAFTFTGPANSVDVTFNCNAPTLTARATPSDCSQDSNGNYICTDTLALASGSQGDLNWSASASSNLPGVTFNPANGTLVPGQAPQVTITVPSNDCTDGSFIYSGQGGNTATVTWTCTPTAPTLNVSQTSLSDTSGNPCTFDSTSNTWSCTVTVSEPSGSQGNLNWSASSNLNGVTFNPPNGTLSPGQSTQVTISGIPCVSSGTFTFSGGANPVNVSWTCGSSTPASISSSQGSANGYSVHIKGGQWRRVKYW